VIEQAKGKLVFPDSKGNLLRGDRMRDKMHKIWAQNEGSLERGQ